MEPQGWDSLTGAEGGTCWSYRYNAYTVFRMDKHSERTQQEPAKAWQSPSSTDRIAYIVC